MNLENRSDRELWKCQTEAQNAGQVCKALIIEGKSVTSLKMCVCFSNWDLSCVRGERFSPCQMIIFALLYLPPPKPCKAGYSVLATDTSLENSKHIPDSGSISWTSGNAISKIQAPIDRFICKSHPRQVRVSPQSGSCWPVMGWSLWKSNTALFASVSIGIRFVSCLPTYQLGDLG